jgi:hypothetical protein
MPSALCESASASAGRKRQHASSLLFHAKNEKHISVLPYSAPHKPSPTLEKRCSFPKIATAVSLLGLF